MGFEPTSELPRYSISNAAPSTTRPPLRNFNQYNTEFLFCQHYLEYVNNIFLVFVLHFPTFFVKIK